VAITATNLTNANDTDQNDTSYTTASISPGANRLLILAVDATPSDGTAVAPTVTGNGLTWVEFGAGGEYGTSDRAVWLFRAMGASPSAGAVTMDYGAVNQTNTNWSINEFTDVDTTGTNGSGAIVQTVKDLSSTSGTSVTVNLAALGSANNMAFGAFSHAAAEAKTVGSGFTALSNTGNITPSISLMCEYQLNVTTVDASWSTNQARGVIAVEIKAGAGGATPKPKSFGLMGVSG
jgi:hypothetical protein